MANYSFAGTKTSVERKTCNICGYISLIIPGNVNNYKVCPGCKTEYDKHVFHAGHKDEVHLVTHTQVKWGCKSCGHYGIAWTKKNKRFVYCPNCKAEPPALIINFMPAAGRCATIWKQDSHMPLESV